MIDEQVLRETMDDAASTQDGLRPRTLDDDLAAGHRRLRRNRIVGGGGTLVAAVAVGAVILSTMNWVGPDASPTPPVAGTTGPATTQRAEQTAPPPAWTPGKALPTTGSQQQRLMLKVLSEHLDPNHQHLRLTGEEFGRVNGLGGVRTLGGRVAYRIAGQPGEGWVSLGIAESAGAIKPCGVESDHPMTCHEVTLPNGRKAQLGRDGDYAVAYYLRPDGKVGTASVNPLFFNNTTIPLHDIRITDAQLLAMVQDPRMDLPALTQRQEDEKAKLTGFKPTRQELRQAADRHLTGGTLTEGYFETVPEEIGLNLTWRGAGVKQDLFVAVYAGTLAQSCLGQLAPSRCERIAVPGGRVVLYGETATRRGASYQQADGNWAVVHVSKVPGKPGKGITKQQLVELATDPGLDK